LRLRLRYLFAATSFQIISRCCVLEAVQRTHCADTARVPDVIDTVVVAGAGLRIRGDTERKQPEDDEGVNLSEEAHIVGGSVWGWMCVWKWRPRPD
jgi:hypothetical protein